VRGLWLGIVAAVAASMFLPTIGQAAYTPPSLYDCRPRNPKAADPPPQPVLPPEVAAALPDAIRSDHFERLCPSGEVPHPTGRPDLQKGPSPTPRLSSKGQAVRVKRGRHRKPPVARAARIAVGTLWYSYAIGYQYFNASKGVNGIWASQTNEEPYVSSVGGDKGHSIGQLWGSSSESGCTSTAEIGWRVAPASYGNPYPHLFIFGSDCSYANSGYAASGWPWVQSSGVIFPGSLLSHNDYFHVYGARMDGNNWWFYYDGQWVGYIPHEAWKYYFPSKLTLTEGGGEVATSAFETCTDMGYAGLYGTHPWAAMFGDVWYEYDYNTKASSSYLNSWISDSNYTTGNWSAGYPGSEFRYGGPGWC
jgi:hypothetical protein